jgi:RNA polymerase sigma factor (sigma-70 family)
MSIVIPNTATPRRLSSLNVEIREMTKPLLPQVADGDREAIQECVERYGRLIWSLANRLIPNKSEVEDAVHDVFIEIWQSAAKFDPSKGDELTFVAMLTRRRLVDRWRANLRRQVGNVDIGEVEIAAPMVRDRSEVNDEAEKAYRCFEKLTQQTQTVLKRSIHDNLSYAKIAEQLQLPLGSVKSYARRGLIQIRECMGRNIGATAMENS